MHVRQGAERSFLFRTDERRIMSGYMCIGNSLVVTADEVGSATRFAVVFGDDFNACNRPQCGRVATMVKVNFGITEGVSTCNIKRSEAREIVDVNVFDM